MNKISQYLLANRFQAMLLALILATLPILSVSAMILLAFLTLRQGWKSGLGILIATLIPSFVVLSLAKVDVLSLVIISSINILVWILACELRRTVSWVWVIEAGAGLGIIVVCVLHLVFPDLILWWQDNMQAYLDQAKQLWAAMPVDRMGDFIHRTAKIATGAQAAMVLIMALTCLAVGRYWQASLFNPGQLKPELQCIRLSRGFVSVLIVLAVAAGLGRIEMLIDTLPILVMALALAGLSLFHYGLAARKIGTLWLIVFYVVGSILMTYSLVALCLLGLIDSFWDLRKKINTKI
jgi:hypothetical protein